MSLDVADKEFLSELVNSGPSNYPNKNDPIWRKNHCINCYAKKNESDPFCWKCGYPALSNQREIGQWNCERGFKTANKLTCPKCNSVSYFEPANYSKYNKKQIEKGIGECHYCPKCGARIGPPNTVFDRSYSDIIVRLVFGIIIALAIIAIFSLF